MPTIIAITAYAANELDVSAWQTAYEDNYDFNIHSDWHDAAYEDFRQIGNLIGLSDLEMQFSGFSRQGDGASFTGHYAHKAGALAAVKQHAPLASSLHAIVQDLVSLQRDHGYRLECRIYSSASIYVHSDAMRFDVEEYPGLVPEAEEKLATCMRALADWLYANLEDEHAHLTSEDVVREALIANEVKFTESGETL